MGKINQTLSLSFIYLIKIYQLLIRPIYFHHCRFYPTCSHFAIETLQRHKIYGLFFIIKRIISCHPFHPGGYDPVPH